MVPLLRSSARRQHIHRHRRAGGKRIPVDIHPSPESRRRPMLCDAGRERSGAVGRVCTARPYPADGAARHAHHRR